MFLVFSHLCILAVCLILKVLDVNTDVVGLFFVVGSSIATLFFIINLKKINKWAKIIILLGFVVRLVLVFVDVFVTRLPDTGTDDDGFFRESLNAFNDGNYDFSQNMHGNFSGFLAISYFFIGSSRFSAQYLNVLFYAISVIVFLKALINFGVLEQNQKILLAILCFMPNAVLYNSILRRETIMEMCVCSSVYYFSRWYNNQKLLYAVATVVFVAVASLFHTALIIGAPVFVIYFALYDKNKRSISFSINKFSKMIIVLFCVVSIGLGFLSLWSNKFSSVSDMDDIYTAANRTRGGSAYLSDYKVNNIGQLLLFTPLKLFYFFFSPVPWMFRSVMDVVSFSLDALVYFVLLYKSFRGTKSSASRLMLAIFIILSIVFAIGTFNSGTAIRHRFSVLPFLLIAYSMSDRTVQAKRKELLIKNSKNYIDKNNYIKENI